jgi:hypothetical protein
VASTSDLPTLGLPKFIPLATLIKELRVSFHVLRGSIAAGRLKAVRVGGRWFITESAIRDFLALPADWTLPADAASPLPLEEPRPE